MSNSVCYRRLPHYQLTASRYHGTRHGMIRGTRSDERRRGCPTGDKSSYSSLAPPRAAWTHSSAGWTSAGAMSLSVSWPTKGTAPAIACFSKGACWRIAASDRPRRASRPGATYLDRLWHTVELTLVEPQRAAQGEICVSGRVLVPPPSRQFGVISDIDDTVIRTEQAPIIVAGAEHAMKVGAVATVLEASQGEGKPPNVIVEGAKRPE